MAAAGCVVLLLGAYLVLAAHGEGSPRHHQHEKPVVAGGSGIPVSVSPPRAIPGRLERVHFYSRALGRVADYLVYLPADYSPSRRLPVFYGLHGMPGQPLAFTDHAEIESRLEKLIRHGRVPPMILVFPDGRIDGRTATDSEWANTPSGRFESYLVDVVHDVDRRFATLPHRQDRVIAGLSAGAYGAANVGLHQLRLFGSIQVWSGYFIETHDGVFAHATPAQMADNSPIDYVRRLRRALRRYPLRIFLYIGYHDEFRLQIAPMAAALKAEGADVGWAIYPGGHSWQLWSPRTDQMLIRAGYGFRHRLRPRRPARPLIVRSEEQIARLHHGELIGEPEIEAVKWSRSLVRAPPTENWSSRSSSYLSPLRPIGDVRNRSGPNCCRFAARVLSREPPTSRLT